MVKNPRKARGAKVHDTIVPMDDDDGDEIEIMNIFIPVCPLPCKKFLAPPSISPFHALCLSNHALIQGNLEDVMDLETDGRIDPATGLLFQDSQDPREEWVPNVYARMALEGTEVECPIKDEKSEPVAPVAPSQNLSLKRANTFDPESSKKALSFSSSHEKLPDSDATENTEKNEIPEVAEVVKVEVIPSDEESEDEKAKVPVQDRQFVNPITATSTAQSRSYQPFVMLSSLP